MPRDDTADDTADDTGTPPDDADGDGFGTKDGDCDDSNAAVHPGAADEACDGVDQDCDGEPNPAGTCSDHVQLGPIEVGTWEGETRSSLIVPMEVGADYSGDGMVDLAAMSHCADLDNPQCTGAVTIFAGVPSGDLTASEADAPTLMADWLQYIKDVGSGGDLDGDGQTDLVVTSHGCDLDAGVVYAFGGPSTRWPSGASLLADSASWSWEQAEPGDCFALSFWGEADADGDGIDDLLTTGGGLRLLHGGGALARDMSLVGQPWLADLSASEGAAMLPDLDGDGVAEVAFAAWDLVETESGYDSEWHAGYVPVPALEGGHGEQARPLIEEVALGSFEGIYFLDRSAALGDDNGDGYEDALVVVGKDMGDEIVLCAGTLHGAADARGADLELAIPGLLCPDPALSADISDPRIVPDLDGDGRTERLLGHPYQVDGYEDVSACLVASSRLPDSGWDYFSNLRPYCFSFTGAAGYEGDPAAGDLNGDGLPELLIGETWDRDADETMVNRIHVAPGFAIPFADDSRW